MSSSDNWPNDHHLTFPSRFIGRVVTKKKVCRVNSSRSDIVLASWDHNNWLSNLKLKATILNCIFLRKALASKENKKDGETVSCTKGISWQFFCCCKNTSYVYNVPEQNSSPILWLSIFLIRIFLGLKEGSVLKNSGNSLSDWHWNFTNWTRQC